MLSFSFLSIILTVKCTQRNSLLFFNFRCMLNKRVNQLEFYKSEKDAETERPNEYEFL